jgi:replication-associated recombination protein RarA
MNLEEKCFSDLDFLYPKMESTKSDSEIDKHLAAALNVLYLDEIRRENKRRQSMGLPRISPEDLVNEWHVSRRFVED